MASTDGIAAMPVLSPDMEKSSYPSSDNNEKSSQNEDPQAMERLGMNQDSADGTVQRNLKQRHLSMIALGGTIGTGLFVGLGGSLANAGPVSTLIAYTIMGVVVYSMMVALGEVSTLLAVPEASLTTPLASSTQVLVSLLVGLTGTLTVLPSQPRFPPLPF